VHVVYGGAQLFKSTTPGRVGEVALKALETYFPSPKELGECLEIEATSEEVYARIVAKLRTEPVEDYRIDFEDGYGYRPDAEEDRHAASAARELAAGMGRDKFPPYVGLRIKPFTDALYRRSFRTLGIFLDQLLDATGGRLPANFVVTLPKITSAEQVAILGGLLTDFEARSGLGLNTIRIEVMMETVQSVADVPGIVAAGGFRCRGAHFGAYDYTADCNIAAQYQDIGHPACDFARNLMQVHLSGRGIWLADSVTTMLPIVIHKGTDLSPEQVAENDESMRRGWRRHFGDVRRSLANGFYQSWDIHPAQLVSRYAAVYSFFLEAREAALKRLRNFMDKATQATTAGSEFDDAASAQGLLNFFLRGLNCGALTEQEVLEAGLTADELRTRSFAAMMAGRVL